MKIAGHDIDLEMVAIGALILVAVIGLIFGSQDACSIHISITQTTTTTVKP